MRPYFQRYSYPGITPDVPGLFEVTCVAFASLVDTDFFTVFGPLGTKIFEFDTAGNGPTVAGRIAIPVLAGDTAAQVRDKTVAAINSVAAAGIGVSAVASTTPPGDKLFIAQGVPGPAPLSLSENVTAGGFGFVPVGAGAAVGTDVQPGRIGDALAVLNTDVFTIPE